MPEGTEQSSAETSQSQGITPEFLEQFKSSLLGDIDKKLNGAIKNVNKDVEKRFKEFKPATSEQQHAESEGEHTESTSAEDQSKKGFDAMKVQNLERKLAQMEKSQREREDQTRIREQKAAEKEQSGLVRSALSGFPWREGAANLAFNEFNRMVQRDEDGNLFVGEGVSLEEAAKTFAESNAFLLQVKEVGGSGAQRHSGANGKTMYKLSDYDANWSNDKKKEFGEAVLQGRVTE